MTSKVIESPAAVDDAQKLSFTENANDRREEMEIGLQSTDKHTSPLLEKQKVLDRIKKLTWRDWMKISRAVSHLIQFVGFVTALPLYVNFPYCCGIKDAMVEALVITISFSLFLMVLDSYLLYFCYQ